MDIFTIAIVVSILVYIAVGNYAGRRVKDIDDYYVAGRRAPTILIVGTLVASVLSTNAFLGESGFVYAGQAGPYLIWPPIAASGYIFGALFFGRYLRRSRALTMGAYFGSRFNSQRVQTAAGVTVILGLGGYLLAVTQGAAVILSQLTGITYLQGTVVAWVSYTAFTIYSGSRGVVITDTLMFLLFSTVDRFGPGIPYRRPGRLACHHGWPDATRRAPGNDGLVRNHWRGHAVEHARRLHFLGHYYRRGLGFGVHGQPMAIEPLPDSKK